jgi:hypothetical protein
MYSPSEPPKQAEADAPEQAELEAWRDAELERKLAEHVAALLELEAAEREAKLEREAAAFEAALPELEKWWQQERDERRADADAKAWQRERDERLIAEYEAAEARELEHANRWFRWNLKRGVALWRRSLADREANRRIVTTPPARRRGAGRPAGAARRSGGGADDDGASHPDNEPPPLARARLRAGSTCSRAPPRPPPIHRGARSPCRSRQPRRPPNAQEVSTVNPTHRTDDSMMPDPSNDRYNALDCAITAAEAASQATVAIWRQLTLDERDRWLEWAPTSWPRRDVFLKTILPAAAEIIANEALEENGQ